MPRALSIIDLAKRDHLTAAESDIADIKLAELASEDKLNMEVAGSYPLLHLAINYKNVDLVRKLLNMNGINVNQEINVSAPGRIPQFLAPIQLAAKLAVAPGPATQKKINIISMLEHEGAAAEDWESMAGDYIVDAVADQRVVAVPVAEEVEADGRTRRRRRRRKSRRRRHRTGRRRRRTGRRKKSGRKISRKLR